MFGNDGINIGIAKDGVGNDHTGMHSLMKMKVFRVSTLLTTGNSQKPFIYARIDQDKS